MRSPHLLALVLAFALAGPATSAEDPQLHPPAVVPVIGLKLTAPQLVSFPVGLVFRRTWRRWPRHEYWSGGPLIQVEPGLRGHKVNLGWAFISPDRWPPLGSLSFRLSGLRATCGGLGAERRTNYLGGEVAAHLQDVGVSVGLYMPVESEGRDRPFLFSAGLGFGFP